MQGTEADRRLAETFARYERAVETGDRAELCAARLLLCLVLERTGWEPPAEVRDQKWRDRKALRQLEQEPAHDVVEPVLRPPSHRPPGSPRAVLPFSATG